MKRMFILLLAALFLALATSCDPEQEEQERQVLLVYFAGNNSLSSEGAGDLQEIKENWLPATKERRKIVLVYHHFVNETPQLLRLSRDNRGNTVEEIIMEYPATTNSADTKTLGAVLADARNAWPAAHWGLILWSHGSGFLPPGYYANPKESTSDDPVFLDPDPYADMVKSDEPVKSFAEQNDSEMDIIDLRKVLSSAHYDFILFDACLMANVEVAYELRNCTDYLLFSPTEILSDGFPYKSMMQPIFTLQPAEAMLSIAHSYMNHYRSLSGTYQSATIALVRTQYMPQLAEACRPIFQRHQEQILTLDRSQVQPYFRYSKHWFYDIDDFVGQVADSAEMAPFSSALNNVVIFKDTTPHFLDIDFNHYSGLSIYIPRAEYTVLNNYYKTLGWNQATGLVK